MVINRRNTRVIIVLLCAAVAGACTVPPTPQPLAVQEVTITEVQTALRAGETTCRMVVQSHLDRIAAYEDFFEHEERQAYLSALVTAMDEARLDAIIYPSWNHPPAHIARAREEYRGDNSQRVAPATGMPAITVPMGFTYDDYPAGLQILARPYAEGLLLRFAYAYEQSTRHRHPPSGFPER